LNKNVTFFLLDVFELTEFNQCLSINFYVHKARRPSVSHVLAIVILSARLSVLVSRTGTEWSPCMKPHRMIA